MTLHMSRRQPVIEYSLAQLSTIVMKILAVDQQRKTCGSNVTDIRHNWGYLPYVNDTLCAWNTDVTLSTDKPEGINDTLRNSITSEKLFGLIAICSY